MTDKPVAERKRIIFEELVKLFNLTNFNGGLKLSVVNGKVIQAQKLESPFNDWD